MQRLWIVIAVLLAAAPAMAAGDLTVFSLAISPPAYANTNQSVNVLNLSLNVTTGSGGDGVVNITSVNITVNSSSEGGAIGNISAVEIRNSTGSTLGSNTTVNPATNITFTVFIPGGFTVNTSNSTILVAINISGSAAPQVNISVNITSGSDIGTNSSANNVTLSGNSIRSRGVQIQSIHALVSISPRFVDTGVENQTFVYDFNITGSDNVQNLTINFPTGYTLVNFTAVERGGANLTSGTDFTNTTLSNQINISLVSATTQRIKVYFNANTSSSTVSSSAFTSLLAGSNLSGIAADALNLNTTNVTTQRMLNLSDVGISKATALVNGTDFWEFNFTLNYTATVSGGLIQFKLGNWTNAEGRNISITNAPGDVICSVTHCATLRNETKFNTTGKFNVTNDYGSVTNGISVSSATKGGLVTLVLRMVVPKDTPVSSTWRATYGFLFRSSP